MKLVEIENKPTLLIETPEELPLNIIYDNGKERKYYKAVTGKTRENLNLSK